MALQAGLGRWVEVHPDIVDALAGARTVGAGGASSGAAGGTRLVALSHAEGGQANEDECGGEADVRCFHRFHNQEQATCRNVGSRLAVSSVRVLLMWRLCTALIVKVVNKKRLGIRIPAE